MNIIKKKVTILLNIILATSGSLCAMESSPKSSQKPCKEQMAIEQLAERPDIEFKATATRLCPLITSYKITAYQHDSQTKLGKAILNQSGKLPGNFNLRWLEVKEGHEGKGTGSALLTLCIRTALTLGADKIKLQALAFRSSDDRYDQNLDRLVKFYQSHGATFVDPSNKYEFSSIRKYALLQIKLTNNPFADHEYDQENITKIAINKDLYP